MCSPVYGGGARARRKKTSWGSVKGRGTTRETARRTSRLLCIHYLLLYYILIVFFVSRCGRVKTKRMLAGRQLLCTTRPSKRVRIKYIKPCTRARALRVNEKIREEEEKEEMVRGKKNK